MMHHIILQRAVEFSRKEIKGRKKNLISTRIDSKMQFDLVPEFIACCFKAGQILGE